MRVVDVRRDASEAVDSDVNLALPAYEWWSMLLVLAVALLLISAMATNGAAPPSGDDNSPVAWTLMTVALVLAALGIVRTRRTIARMKIVEPVARWYHQNALYCEACAHVHFQERQQPIGIEPQVAWTVHDYRRELWYACGFAKSTFPFIAGGGFRTQRRI